MNNKWEKFIQSKDLKKSKSNGDENISTPFNPEHKFHINHQLEWQGDLDLVVRKEEIGEGSFGKVYRGEARDRKTQLAIKLILITSDLDAKVLEHEVKILQKCKHENVVAYWGSQSKKNYLWIYMDFCAMGSVADMMELSKRSFLEGEALWILFCALKGLEYLHSFCNPIVVHRDIKSGNILVTENADVKLADFGVSDLLIDTHFAGQLVGTPLWMAPEVISGCKYDDRADIWSYGITAIELVDGYPPHSDKRPYQVMQLITHNPPPAATSTEVSLEFREFVSKTLQKDYSKRPKASELIKDPIFGETSAAPLKSLVDELIETRKNTNKRLSRRPSRVKALLKTGTLTSSQSTTEILNSGTTKLHGTSGRSNNTHALPWQISSGTTTTTSSNNGTVVFKPDTDNINNNGTFIEHTGNGNQNGPAFLKKSLVLSTNSVDSTKSMSEVRGTKEFGVQTKKKSQVEVHHFNTWEYFWRLIVVLVAFSILLLFLLFSPVEVCDNTTKVAGQYFWEEFQSLLDKTPKIIEEDKLYTL